MATVKQRNIKRISIFLSQALFGRGQVPVAIWNNIRFCRRFLALFYRQSYFSSCNFFSVVRSRNAYVSIEGEITSDEIY